MSNGYDFVQINLKEKELQVQRERAIFESVILYGGGAIKSATLINGGAAVALLAFLEKVAISPDKFIATIGFKWSLTIFVCGTLAGAFSSATAYLTQYYMNENNSLLFKRFKYWSWGLVAFSFFCFAIGTIVSIISLN